mmetsp:Transcript_2651/g.4117  ORF Transcript_2651/g.4117 Transcript_2651/m.4117 type:complete len:92 (-) Transcript_2651:693-968(-)|eukprot:CAMPEP_0170484550 /NCGR_PEP_ID=MMETSP0208-20121228/3979_1 /TAXON_ID=197538 /ORGANISM="Strombidium inclinatum, Strain S3" /LENGTH=91 /DNA_ID=CAMNT_0010757893 /DNA_START=1472 /DNA_END=1747 /DNA_ORIENTATION=-
MSKQKEVEKNEKENSLAFHFYRLLFIILAEMMDPDYNGIYRQILKLFLVDIEVIGRKIMGLKENQSIGYILAIFESEITMKKIKRDFFDLN